MALNPRESGEFIVKNAKHLKVVDTGIQNVANQVIEGIKNKTLSIDNFSQINFHPKSTESYALNWIFIVDTLNFCFWTAEDQAGKFTVEGQSGYFALCAAINRALKENIDITNPSFYSTITLDQMKQVLRPDDGKTEVPLIAYRVQCLHEVGQVILEKYDGDFANCVKSANESASELLKIIVEEFPCFRDLATYNGQRVSILKRAQILVGDVYACFKGEGLGFFKDINETITMFADYRVPQVLVHFESLVYSEELMDDLKSGKVLLNGEEKEVEIRGASIYIVEKVKELVLKYFKEHHPDLNTIHINSILIDHFLWDYRRANAKQLEYIPFHKTYSVYY